MESNYLPDCSGRNKTREAMKAELSQPTLGVVRHALDEMSDDILDRSELSAFWKDTLFDFVSLQR